MLEPVCCRACDPEPLTPPCPLQPEARGAQPIPTPLPPPGMQSPGCLLIIHIAGPPGQLSWGDGQWGSEARVAVISRVRAKSPGDPRWRRLRPRSGAGRWVPSVRRAEWLPGQRACVNAPGSAPGLPESGGRGPGVGPIRFQGPSVRGEASACAPANRTVVVGTRE